MLLDTGRLAVTVSASFMKTYFVLPAIILSLTLGVIAADEKPAPAAEKSAGKADDLSAYKTADALWKHIEELREEPKVQPKSQEELLRVIKEWFGNQRAGAEAFIKTYPKDPRRFSAKMTALQATMQLSQIPGAEPAAKMGADEVLKELDAIVAAPDAPEEAKGEASFIKTMMLTEKLDDEKPETVAAFIKASEEFLAKYASHKLAKEMRQTQMQVAGQAKTPEAETLLKKLAADKDPQVADGAKEILARREKMTSLKTKPLELKFKAVDGAEFDVTKLQGKVVLVDFWASWCGPCIAEMPNVVAVYKKLHEKGFEVVGISLDEDKAKMEAAMAKHGLTWTQYFDGKGWQNTISSGFGIESIPATWLLDKKGMLRETELRGEALGTAVEKLLAE